jgi:hypothetical protein
MSHEHVNFLVHTCTFCAFKKPKQQIIYIQVLDARLQKPLIDWCQTIDPVST